MPLFFLHKVTKFFRQTFLGKSISLRLKITSWGEGRGQLTPEHDPNIIILFLYMYYIISGAKASAKLGLFEQAMTWSDEGLAVSF